MNNEINSKILSIKDEKIPLGYKKTKVGIIPNDWEEKNLSDLIKELETGVSVNSYDFKAELGQKAVLKTSCVSSGKFNSNENKVIIEKEVDRAKLNPRSGEIIISRMNTPQLVGEIGYIEKGYPDLFLPDRLWQTKLYENVDGKWLAESLITEKIKYQIKDIATGTSNSMKNISKPSFLAIKVPFTRYEEQKKIASILVLWYKAIELKEELLQEKQKQKKGLMERLLTGKVRLSDFNETWKEVKLGSAIDVIKKEAVTSPQDYNLLTVKLHVKGIEATGKKPNATEKGRPYYLRMPGELLIGRQNFHNGGIGIVPNDMNDYIASNAITSLKVINGDLQFYFYYLSNSSFYKRVGNIIGGTGQKEISETMLKKLKVTVPANIEEQKKIAKIIGVANAEVELLEKEIDLLKSQKKGLMQLLLTGIVRVKCD